MRSKLRLVEFDLIPSDNQRFAILCGEHDGNLKQVEQQFQVKITKRGATFQISGELPAAKLAHQALIALYTETQTTDYLTPQAIHLVLTSLRPNSSKKQSSAQQNLLSEQLIIHTKNGSIKPRSLNQQKYLQHIHGHDINFGIGPAGTGKTYLAVACAIAALEAGRVRRILLVRPAVEAGERLGFLPGDLAQKIDPYLRPLYDALYEMLGFEKVAKLLERNIIEIAPLAYMRGRTLNEAFIILDEGQNTTREQMKMFLTRIGFNSVAVINGDITQIDLPKGVKSGLCHALQVLHQVPGISVTTFQSQDVVRHPLVQAIVNAYDKYQDHDSK